jgi:uncharacterized protein
MANLRIARDLALPVDVVTQAIAILARKGAGKTYTASVIVEEAVRAKVPVVVVDPTGAWWGLRTSADGERPGLPVTIFGGDHGDVPLEPTAGAVIADVVVEHPGAYVIDLSGFPSRASEQRFAGDFLERLYRAKTPASGPLLLVVDEADMFAPQRPGKEQLRTLGALEAIVRRGRIKGLGDLLITQRAAVLNKNVLTQTEVLIVMQTTGPQDRAAIGEWIDGIDPTREQRDEVLGSLGGLGRGEAWVWSPSFLKVLERVRIRERTTYDSSRTPTAGEALVAPRAFAKVDLEKLGARIVATIEKAKAEDPKELRRRIAELERAAAAAPVPPEVREVIVEVPVLNGQVDKLDDIVSRLTTTAMAIGDLGKDIGGIALEIVSALGRVSETPTRGQVERAPRGVQAQPGRDRGATAVATPAPAVRREPAPIVDGPVSLDKAQRALLTALAQFPDGMSKVRLSLVAGYSIKSSSFSNALGALRSAGLVERGSDPIRPTADGLAMVPDAPPAPTSNELLDYWLGRLDKAQRAILTAVVAQHPRELTKDELSQLSGYSVTSSSFSNAIGALRSLGLLERGGLRATEDLGL